MKTLLFAIALVAKAAHADGYYQPGYYGQSPQLYSQGQYLGNLNSNRLDPNSISNPIGRYGSPISPDSINNPIGRYGSPISPDSVRSQFGYGVRVYGR